MAQQQSDSGGPGSKKSTSNWTSLFKPTPYPGANGWSVTTTTADDPATVVTGPRTPGGSGSTDTTTKPPTTGGSGGGGGGAKKSNDAPQLAALRAMLDSGFAASRDIKLGNIERSLQLQDEELLTGYSERATGLEGARSDNEKAASDSSFANILNRVRERSDILAESATQGAGESDTLKSQLQALRNWSGNQADVNRSYFDTNRSVNSAITDLNSDTRTARKNAWSSAQSDMEQVWGNFYNQRADAFTQMGNIQANPYSDSYKKGSTAYADAAAETAKSWVNPGLPANVKDWAGTTQAAEGRLNNTDAEAAVTNLAQKKPEGATLRKW